MNGLHFLLPACSALLAPAAVGGQQHVGHPLRRSTGLSWLLSESLRHPIRWLPNEFLQHPTGVFLLASSSLQNLSAIQWATTTVSSNEVCSPKPWDGDPLPNSSLPWVLCFSFRGRRCSLYLRLCLLVLFLLPGIQSPITSKEFD